MAAPVVSFEAYVPKTPLDYIRAGNFLFTLAGLDKPELGLQTVKGPDELLVVQWERQRPKTLRRLTQYEPDLFELDRIRQPGRGQKTGSVAVWLFGKIGLVQVVNKPVPARLFSLPEELMDYLSSDGRLVVEPLREFHLPVGALRDEFVLDFVSATQKD